MIMKKILFSLLLLFSVSHLYAQIPVTDVAANTNIMTNQIMNATTWSNQLTQLMAQNATLTTTLKYVQNVSSIVRDISYAKDLIERQGYIVKRCEHLLKNQDKLDAKKARDLSNTVSSFLVTNNSLINLINSTLTTKLKMNDSERMQMMMNVKQEQAKIIASLSQVDFILSTSQATKDIIEYKLFE